jgi:hypothetical protein
MVVHSVACEEEKKVVTMEVVVGAAVLDARCAAAVVRSYSRSGEARPH